MGYPKMEKMPKGVMSSDMTGDKKVKVPKEEFSAKTFMSKQAPRRSLSDEDIPF